MDATLTIEAWSFDPGTPARSPGDFAEAVLACIHQSCEAGAGVVVLPEFLWLGLQRFEPDLKKVARLFWGDLWPECSRQVPPEVLVLAGTAPHGVAALTNRAVLSLPHEQDKLCLTPWESDFRGGEALEVFPFRGCRVAVLICLDVEIPELVPRLRGRDLDLLLVPSATESLLGVERVHRCASARAVELGCAVVVSPLTGKGPGDLIDESLGHTAFYLPSQSPFADGEREIRGPLHTSGNHRQRFILDLEALRRCRAAGRETNPARFGRPGG